MAMRQPGPPEVRRSGRRSWIQIPILLLLMKVFYNVAKRSEIGHVRIGIGLRISGRTSLILQTRGSTGALILLPYIPYCIVSTRIVLASRILARRISARKSEDPS